MLLCLHPFIFLLFRLYRGYSFAFIPLLGQLLASDRDSYQYLIESIERFPTQANFSRMIRHAGFTLSGTPEARAAGLPDLAGSSRDGNVAMVGEKADEIIRDLAKKAGVRLPGQVHVGQEREPKEFDQDVKNSWEDLSFGIASMWTGWVRLWISICQAEDEERKNHNTISGVLTNPLFFSCSFQLLFKKNPISSLVSNFEEHGHHTWTLSIPSLLPFRSWYGQIFCILCMQQNQSIHHSSC